VCSQHLSYVHRNTSKYLKQCSIYSQLNIDKHFICKTNAQWLAFNLITVELLIACCSNNNTPKCQIPLNVKKTGFQRADNFRNVKKYLLSGRDSHDIKLPMYLHF
jgi:hypothetical protein